MLDFIGFINDNVDLAVDKKLALLNDFCAQYAYEEFIFDDEHKEVPNPETKRQFANRKISRYIIESVHAARRKTAVETIELEELVLEPVP